jgi:hypothetical protein
MRQVLAGQLWLGNAQDARDMRRVCDLGVRAIVDLAMEELPAKSMRELIYCRFPLIDGAGNSPAVIASAINTTIELIHRGLPTLVSCGAGMSRAPSIVAAAIALWRAEPPEQWLVKLAEDAPHDVSPLLWGEVRRVAEELQTETAIKKDR